MEAIRNCGLDPISKIKTLYEDAIKSCPDSFDLTDRAEGTEVMLMRFREGTSESHVEIIPDDYLHMSLARGKHLQMFQSLSKVFNL